MRSACLDAKEDPMNQRNLLEVDWSKIPAPTDDGAAAHLVGMTIPPISLVATDDLLPQLSAPPSRTVGFAYPRTGRLLPFPVRSDEKLALTRALVEQTMQVPALTMICSPALIVAVYGITHEY